MNEDQSFVEFTRANYTSLLGTAMLLTGSGATAEDLVQETLTKLYANWWRVDAADIPLAYVRRSLTNTFLTSARRRSAGELAMASLPEAAAIHDPGEDVVDRRFAAQLLAHLSHRQRAAVVMRYFHDMDDAQIAETVGCLRVTVRSLISRGLTAMRVESDRMESDRIEVVRIEGVSRRSAS